MDEGLSDQKIPPEKSAGIVVGSGGLPYILGHLGVSTLFLADLHQSVIDYTRQRIQALDDVESWPDYQDRILDGLSQKIDIANFKEEYRAATRSGMAVDFEHTREVAHSVELVDVPGDLRWNIDTISAQLEARDQEVSFINLTNIANYARPKLIYLTLSGMKNIGQYLGALPLAENALIADSSTLLSSVLIEASRYPGIEPH